MSGLAYFGSILQITLNLVFLKKQRNWGFKNLGFGFPICRETAYKRIFCLLWIQEIFSLLDINLALSNLNVTKKKFKIVWSKKILINYVCIGLYMPMSVRGGGPGGRGGNDFIRTPKLHLCTFGHLSIFTLYFQIFDHAKMS